MQTEQSREQSQIKKLEDAIRLCEESIAKAEPYERLSDNADFKAHLANFEIRAKMHDREIQLAVSQLDDAPNNSYLSGDGKLVSSKLDWVDFIRNHKIRADVLREWGKEPDLILKLAAISRESLPKLKEKIDQIKNVPATNGVS